MNGNGKLTKWVLGVVAALIVASAGYLYAFVGDTTAAQAKNDTIHAQWIRDLNRVDKRLDRIEDKIDELRH